MYILIREGLASMMELKNCYTLDEAIKLYAIYEMQRDVQTGHIQDAEEEAARRK